MDNDTEASLKPDTKVGSYVIRKFLGAGASGEVYEAYDKKIGLRVALKLLSASIAVDEATSIATCARAISSLPGARR